MRQAIALWDSILGVDEDIATILVAEMGIRSEQFVDGAHAASWTAICPGNYKARANGSLARRVKGIDGSMAL